MRVQWEGWKMYDALSALKGGQGKNILNKHGLHALLAGNLEAHDWQLETGALLLRSSKVLLAIQFNAHLNTDTITLSYIIFNGMLLGAWITIFYSSWIQFRKIPFWFRRNSECSYLYLSKTRQGASCSSRLLWWGLGGSLSLSVKLLNKTFILNCYLLFSTGLAVQESCYRVTNPGHPSVAASDWMDRMTGRFASPTCPAYYVICTPHPHHEEGPTILAQHLL